MINTVTQPILNALQSVPPKSSKIFIATLMQARGPMMMAPPQMMMMMPPQQPQMTEDMMMMGGMQDELCMIEQDLNMTRRATRYFEK